MASISSRVYTDSPAQPSRPGGTVGGKIKVTNQRRIFLEEIDGYEPPSFDMTIHDPHLLRPKNSEQMHLDEIFKRVLTSCNLHLKHVGLSTAPPDTEPVKYNPDPPKYNSYVKKTSGVIEIVIVSPPKNGSHVSFAMYSEEELDEKQVFATLNMIHAIYDDKSPSVKVSNLAESLKAYSRGVTSRHREEAFMGLFAALEKAVNFDEDSSGARFDSKTRGLVGDQGLPIDEMREAYNRLKHHTPKNKMRSHPDDAAIHSHVRRLRPAAARAILYRMAKVRDHRAVML